MEDVSKEVVAVILVIAIVISVLGTWLVLDSATSIRTGSPGMAEEPTVGGKVKLGIIQDVLPDSKSGQVSLGVIN